MNTLEGLLPLFPLTIACDPAGWLSIAGLRLSALGQEWGTPLYLYDGATIRQHVEALQHALAVSYPGQAEITYAAKAYFAPAFARRLAALGVGVDVVSQGELAVALQAGFRPGKIHLHGNNKLEMEITTALGCEAQAIVIDSLDELAFVESLAQRQRQTARVWLRITPGIAVDTHAYRQTGHQHTKFGLPIAGGQAAQAVQAARRSRWLELTGLHTHLGSHISDAQPYREAVHMLFDLAHQQDFIPAEFSPGGGWYARYLPQDPQYSVERWVSAVSEAVQAECSECGWPLPKLVLEPGRWLVARAGVSLYTVGACKASGDGTRWAAVDGGMADNLRPALYGAVYTALLPERALEPATGQVNIVGKYCESGDQLIAGAHLPEVRRGDLLAIPVAGAYHLSMASNYNLAPRPVALWLENGQAELLQARETIPGGWWSG